MKTIAQQLKVTDFPFIIKNKDCKEIYREDFTGYWRKKKSKGIIEINHEL